VRSRIFLAQKKFPEALDSAMKARNLEPDRAGYHLNLALIRFASSDPVSAIEASKYVARRWTLTDRFEALTLLAWFRSQSKMPASTEQAAEESALGTDIASLKRFEGVVDSVSCEKSKPLLLTLRQGEKRQKFQPDKDLKGLGFGDTLWYGTDHFDPCHHTPGLNAVVWYVPQSENETLPVTFVEFHDDALAIPQSAAAP
jgi:hypothetical protein